MWTGNEVAAVAGLFLIIGFGIGVYVLPWLTRS
jgi:hypothetical protein